MEQMNKSVEGGKLSVIVFCVYNPKDLYNKKKPKNIHKLVH